MERSCDGNNWDKDRKEGHTQGREGGGNPGLTWNRTVDGRMHTQETQGDN